MHPVLFELGNWGIRSYAVVAAIGFLALYGHLEVAGRRRGFGRWFAADVTVGIVLSGLFGARVVYVVTNLSEFGHDIGTMMSFHTGGLVFYGGILGGGLFIWVYSRVHRKDFVALLDWVVSGVPLFHALARIGCLLSGCCMGKETSGWPSIYVRGAHRHPTQVYEVGLNAIIYLLLLRVARYGVAGRVSACYLIFYGGGRFFVEFVRESATPFALGLSLSQVLSIGIVLTGIVVYGLSERDRIRSGAREKMG